MRNIRSLGYFEQMKGRGCRVVDPDVLQSVTPDARHKTHFVIVDAVGVCHDEKTATKPIIKSLFNRLAGKTGESADFPALVDGQKITADKLPAIQPEDTLIITYSGHGYADRNGIFYLLPYDIGANTEKLTTEVLPKMISSDELSLWMRDAGKAVSAVARATKSSRTASILSAMCRSKTARTEPGALPY